MGRDSNEDKTVEDQAKDSPVIDLRAGGGWEAALAAESFPDSND
jgi:hypothetical protein